MSTEEEILTSTSGAAAPGEATSDVDAAQPNVTAADEMPATLQPRLHVHQDSVAYITVSDPVQHSEGLKGKFTAYRVAYDPPPPAADADATGAKQALLPYATSVNRRYSDFSWLFDHLHKERPGAIVPPLPEKQQVSRFSDDFIEERRFHLEIFLRRVVCNPELKDTECLLVFLGGGDAEFKKAKKDGSFGTGSATSNADAAVSQTMSDEYNDGIEMRDDHHHEHTLVDKGKDFASHKKKGLKKWLKEKKTNFKGTLVRSPEDPIFEEVAHFVSALEAGLKRVEAQASAMVKRDKEVSASLLEFGLGCEAIAHVEDEINGTGVEDVAGSSGIGQTFRMVGKTADAVSAISSEHHLRELGCFAEPLRDHLKMVHSVKVALSKRQNRRITYSTCLNAVDSKKESLHKYRITPGQEGKAFGVESSLSRAESSLLVAQANYQEVSARVLREVDRFRKENAVAMYATMVEFARAQKEQSEKLSEAWAALLPQVESVDATKCNGSSFAQTAAALKDGSRTNVVAGAGGSVEAVAAQVDNMAMPSYPPPPEPASAQGAGNMESSMLNGAVRYRDPLPEE
ncbi:hypothetical protein ACHAXT_006887 [Thalassiosira profunda]